MCKRRKPYPERQFICVYIIQYILSTLKLDLTQPLQISTITQWSENAHSLKNTKPIIYEIRI